MKKAIIWLMLIMSAFVLIGCSSKSQSIYIINPTPLKKESSKYYVKDLNVTLYHGHGRNLENKTFSSEQELQGLFAKDIQAHLVTKKIFSKDGYGLSITLDYTRTYNYGGNALNKPQYVYTVKIYDSSNNTLLVSYSIPPSTTKYAYLEDAAVSFKIGLYQWGAEDEPRDIDLISKTLVNEISLLGN